jgi:hypothetical protein
MIDWQMQPQYYGAFKLNYPGQDVMNQRAIRAALRRGAARLSELTSLDDQLREIRPGLSLAAAVAREI